jgi:hypothetical protein
MYGVYDEDNGEFERIPTHKAMEEHIDWLLQEGGVPARSIVVFREMNVEIKMDVTVKVSNKK